MASSLAYRFLRHWTISWLRAHNYPDFRFLIDIRNLTDEEAFRLADLENRARDDLTDLERARDYLRALDTYYEGRQKIMAERINVTESWLSRYQDLARLPRQLMAAFAVPQDLRIKHVTAIKPLLKPEERRQRVFDEATRLAKQQVDSTAPMAVPDVIRTLALAADPPKKSGSPKRSGKANHPVGGGLAAAEGGGCGSQGSQAYLAATCRWNPR